MSGTKTMQQLQEIIESSWEQRSTIKPDNCTSELTEAIENCLTGLENGSLRVAQPLADGWQVNEWLKKAVLLYFRTSPNQIIQGGHSHYFDKVPLRWADADGGDISSTGARIVPTATVRRGAFIGNDCVLMPSYVNIGAYVGAGSMVDTWATVGSCAQIGANVHLSGGVGIGGVLEPLQAKPTIIEDDCFIGARSEVVEGVIVERGSVLSMGVFISQSTRIYNRKTGEISFGKIPAGSVVVPGSLPASDGSHSLYAAIIVKQVDAQTRAKTSVNELLRSAES